MHFTKIHGLGNDCVYVDCIYHPAPRDPGPWGPKKRLRSRPEVVFIHLFA